MKKNIQSIGSLAVLATFLALFSCKPLVGQHHLGIRGGIQFNNITISENTWMPDTRFRTGIVGGVSYLYDLPGIFTVGADLLCAQKGWKIDAVMTNQEGLVIGEGEAIYKYDYFSIPLKAGISLGDRMSLFANLGIVPSFPVSARAVVPVVSSDDHEADMMDHVNSFDIAGLAEVGGSLAFASRYTLFLAVSYEHSFSAFNVSFFSDSNMRHYSISASTGIRYALGK